MAYPTDHKMDEDKQAAARKSYLEKAKSKYLETKRATLIKNLMEFDKEKRGSFRIDQVADIVEKLMVEKEESAKKSKLIVLLVVSIVVLAAAVFGAVIAGNEITKESVVKDGVLESAATGEMVSTGDIVEEHSLADLLSVDSREALQRLESMISFPMIIAPNSVMRLRPTAYTVEYNEVNTTQLSSVTIYSGFEQYAVKVNETDLYYSTSAGIWEPTTSNRRRLSWGVASGYFGTKLGRFSWWNPGGAGR